MPRRNAKESESRPALDELLKRDDTKLKAYIGAASSLARMIKQLQGSSSVESGSNLSISHTLHDALAAHVSGARVSSCLCRRHRSHCSHVRVRVIPAEEPTLAQQADEELASLAQSLQGHECYEAATLPTRSLSADEYEASDEAMFPIEATGDEGQPEEMALD